MDEKMMLKIENLILSFIPVSECCPEEDGFVLVRKKDRAVTVARHLANEDGDWWENTVGAEIPYDDILEWAAMPYNWQLPDPHEAQKEGYEEYKKKFVLDDIEDRLDQMVDRMELSDEEASIIEEIPRDILYERFEKALSYNDWYWDAYWQTIEEVIMEEIRNEQKKEKKQ